MPTKHNKKRYQRHEKPKRQITISGAIHLMYDENNAYDKPAIGDFMMFASCKELHAEYQGAYGYTGFTGHFKIDVFDGKIWQPVILNGIFPDREHYFGKSECPIDTYKLCCEILAQHKGKILTRTYREHYELIGSDNDQPTTERPAGD